MSRSLVGTALPTVLKRCIRESLWHQSKTLMDDYILMAISLSLSLSGEREKGRGGWQDEVLLAMVSVIFHIVLLLAHLSTKWSW